MFQALSASMLSDRQPGLVEEYLEKGVRDLFVAVQRLALKQADIVLDGLSAPDDLANKIVSLLPAAPAAGAPACR